MFFSPSIYAIIHEGGWLQPLLREALLSDSITEEFCTTVISELGELDLITGKALRHNLLYELRSSGLSFYDEYDCPESLRSRSIDSKPAIIINILLWRWYTLRHPLRETLMIHNQWLDSLEKIIFTPSYSPEYEEVKKHFELDCERCRNNWFMRFSTPRFGDLSDQDRQGNAERRLTLLLAALRLYWIENGVYPEILDQLVPKYLVSLPPDPFSDKPWIYKKEYGEITIASNAGDCKGLAFSFPGETGAEQSPEDSSNKPISRGRLRSIQIWTDNEIERWEGETGVKFPSGLKPIY